MPRPNRLGLLGFGDLTYCPRSKLHRFGGRWHVGGLRLHRRRRTIAMPATTKRAILPRESYNPGPSEHLTKITVDSAVKYA
jgi:hypothetical protein